MNPLYKLLVPILIVLLVLLSAILLQKENIIPSRGAVSQFNDDDDDNNKTVPSLSSDAIVDRLTVHIPEVIQAQASLQTVKLTGAMYRQEIHAFARVIDIQSLLEFRTRYLEAQTEKTIAETALQVSSQEYDRLKLLRSEASNISERQLQQAKLEWMSNQSRLRAVGVKLDNINKQIIQEWGQVLSRHVLDGTDLANDLFQRTSVLLLVTLEGNQPLPSDADTILVSVQGHTGEGRNAYYISPASFTDNMIYGQSYFFHTPATSFPTGIFLDAWIPVTNVSKEGIFIPSAAVIWYADKPWVYIKTGMETFMRREVKDYTVTREGWFVQSGFQPDEDIVLHGSQMLLSEEFRWSIPDEDDNP